MLFVMTFKFKGSSAARKIAYKRSIFKMFAEVSAKVAHGLRILSAMHILL